ncbi:hypothetical protein [Paractinoplanes toevensis]|uniref:hypothetical protein n=1 Tax=Paractinoplanes toevensis TaxID=571911 RepID=UPI001FE8D63B|nr:hypothetical protein [Actinoplanes toevensis]
MTSASHDGRVAELTLFADYHQIHTFNEGSQPDFADQWTGQAVADRLVVTEDAVAIGTTVNVNVAVSVEVLDGSPADDSTEFDHVAEASIRCTSGRLVVMGCTDYEPDAQRFAVEPGWLRMRICQANLDRAYEVDIDSDEDPETMERLRVQIWPAAATAQVVVKRWLPPST